MPRVERACDLVELGLGVAGKVGPLRQVLAEQAIRVLVGPALPRTVRIAEVDLHAGGDREATMGRQFEAAVPGERGHEPDWQPLHVPRERVDDRPRRAPRHTDETDVTRAPLDQRRHVGLPGADEEIALPMPRDRAVLNRRAGRSRIETAPTM